MPIKVLIVDDSALIRNMLTEVLSAASGITVIGTAKDPIDARSKIKELNPDVLTLDIEMPHMDGLSFLEKIMTLRPMPVVMVSSLTQKGADTTIKALELGAVDYVSKISSNTINLDAIGKSLVEKIKLAAKANIKTIADDNFKKVADEKIQFKDNAILAIGSSTGGVDAVKHVLAGLPKNIIPTVITQHMPEKFTKSFAERLDKLFDFHVKEADHGETLRAGNIYIAPGDMHLEVEYKLNKYVAKLNSGPKISGHKPSVDVMFSSVAKAAGNNAVGAILTGMGKDGALGMLEMRQCGAVNIGQDEASSVVYGMPAAAYQIGAVNQVLPLNKISEAIIKVCKC